MSNIGKQYIIIPKQIQLKQVHNLLLFCGPRGKATIQIPKQFSVQCYNNKLQVVHNPNTTSNYAMWGTLRVSISNALVDITDGFTQNLEMVGVGLKVEQQENILIFTLGYSNNITIEIPSRINVSITNGVFISLMGADRQYVCQFGSKLRNLYIPNRYKSKGIRYASERIILKERKTQ